MPGGLPPVASVAVIGVGAIGNALVPRLARMRIHGITLIDGDRVEADNLDRQPLFAETDVGHWKASTARGWAQLIGPGIAVHAIDRFIDPGNVRELLADHTVIAECTDDLHAKDLVDAACAELSLPLVSASVHERQGQVLVLHAGGAGHELRRRDLFFGRPGGEQDGCDMRHVPLEVIEEVGKRMASRLRDVLLGQPVVNGGIDVYLGEKGTWNWFDPPR